MMRSWQWQWQWLWLVLLVGLAGCSKEPAAGGVRAAGEAEAASGGDGAAAGEAAAAPGVAAAGAAAGEGAAAPGAAAAGAAAGETGAAGEAAAAGAGAAAGGTGAAGETGRAGAVVILGGLAGDAGGEGEAVAFGARAQAAVGPLKRELMGALQGAMGQGVEEALAVCNVAAPGIAARASAAAGLDVGRVSHRPRNPGNALAAWMAPAMAHFEGSTAAAPAAAVVMRAPTGGLVYFEPIYTGGLCLSCHGEVIAPGVQAKLAALYPDDRATGFRAGELRGLFRVSSAAR